jgi:hypothetical protein
MLGDSLELVKGRSIKEEEGRPGSWVIEETCEARWVAGFEEATWLDSREES